MPTHQKIQSVNVKGRDVKGRDSSLRFAHTTQTQITCRAIVAGCSVCQAASRVLEFQRHKLSDDSKHFGKRSRLSGL